MYGISDGKHTWKSNLCPTRICFRVGGGTGRMDRKHAIVVLEDNDEKMERNRIHR